MGPQPLTPRQPLCIGYFPDPVDRLSELRASGRLGSTVHQRLDVPRAIPPGQARADPGAHSFGEQARLLTAAIVGGAP
jgi:hypothetical protein